MNRERQEIGNRIAQGGRPGRMSVVLSTQPARFEAVAFKGDFEANLARIAGYGYEGVELAVREPALLDADDVWAKVTAVGLTVPAIGTGQAWGEEGLSFTDPSAEVRAAAIARAKSHIPLAEHLGATIIIGLLRGILRPGVGRDQAMAWLVAALEECCDVAKGAGVRLALEPINRYETTLINTVAQGMALLEAVGATNLGLLLDTFHMNIEEPIIENSIQQAGDHIFHFHVADSNRWHPGAGHLDFATMLTSLFGTGYTGFVSGEFLPMPDAETAALRGIEHLRGLTESGHP